MAEELIDKQSANIEKRLTGEGYAIDIIGTLPKSNDVLITLPGAGDVAALHFGNLTDGLHDKPLGIAISFLKGFNPAKLVDGLSSEMKKLANEQHGINLVIHACSYGASLLPGLVEALATSHNITLKGIIARAPLFDINTFTEKFLHFRKNDKLVLAFTIGMKELFDRGEVVNPDNFASLAELFAQLPERVDDNFFTLICEKNIPLKTIMFSKDTIIDPEIVEYYLGEQNKPLIIESGEERLGHFPANLETFNVEEQRLLVELFNLPERD